MNMQHLKIR